MTMVMGRRSEVVGVDVHAWGVVSLDLDGIIKFDCGVSGPELLMREVVLICIFKQTKLVRCINKHQTFASQIAARISFKLCDENDFLL